MKSFAFFISLAFSLVFSTAASAQITIPLPEKESKSDYVCSINAENPIERGQYDQVLFAGDVFKDENSLLEVIVLKPSLQILRAPDFESFHFSPSQWATLDKSIIMSVHLSPPSLPDAKRTLTISIGRVVSGDSANLWNLTSIAGGYHRNTVLLIDRTLNIAANCAHKSALEK